MKNESRFEIFILKRVKKHMRATTIGHQEKKLGFGLVVLKVKKVIFKWRGFFWLKIEKSFTKKCSYIPLVLGLEGDGTQF